MPNTPRHDSQEVGRAERELELWRSQIDALTLRQRETLALLATGLRSYEIAARLGISEATVKSHVMRIYRRLGVSNRVEATTHYLRASARSP